MTRGQRGRAFARVELALAAFVGFVLVPFIYLASPGMIGWSPPGWLTVAVFVVTVAGIGVGFAWMVRIYRSDPEPDQHAWRYRRDR
jgi:protein-S-isoprenylcysteine O-methyltransferase Ste14